MWTVYVIQSLITKKYYVGVTSNVTQRLHHHNSGANRSTRHKGPWELKYTEEYDNTTEAWRRERKIKSYKGGKAFKKLINSSSIIEGEVA